MKRKRSLVAPSHQMGSVKRLTKGAVASAVSNESSTVVSINQLLRFTLNRQGLLERKTAVSRDLFPLHATATSTPSLSLLARVQRFQTDHLHQFMLQSQVAPLKYVQMRCMRGTLHVIHRDTFEFVADSHKHPYSSAVADRLSKFDVTQNEYTCMSEAIYKSLGKIGPSNTATVTKYLTSLKSKNFEIKSFKIDGKYPVVQSNVSTVLHAMLGDSRIRYGVNNDRLAESKEDIERSWNCSSRLYGITALDSAEDLDIITNYPEGSRDVLHDLMAWYFHCYGPASFQDFVWWSAKKVRDCKPIFQSLLDSAYISPISVGGMPQKMFLCSMHLNELRMTPDLVPTSVRFLPYEDAFIKAYKETRYRFLIDSNKLSSHPLEAVLNDSMHSLTFTGGEALPTIWVDGQIIGKWKCSSGQGKSISTTSTLVIITRTRLTAKLKARLRPELEILCTMLGVAIADVEYLLE